MITYTPEQMAAKLQRLSAGTIPGIRAGMDQACELVVTRSKENCTPGKSPYYRAPFITGMLRDSIDKDVTENGKQLIGEIFDPVDYALAIHEGRSTSSQKSIVAGGQSISWGGPRPFILDAITEEQDTILEILSAAVTGQVRRECI